MAKINKNLEPPDEQQAEGKLRSFCPSLIFHLNQHPLSTWELA